MYYRPKYRICLYSSFFFVFRLFRFADRCACPHFACVLIERMFVYLSSDWLQPRVDDGDGRFLARLTRPPEKVNLNLPCMMRTLTLRVWPWETLWPWRCEWFPRVHCGIHNALLFAGMSLPLLLHCRQGLFQYKDCLSRCRIPFINLRLFHNLFICIMGILILAGIGISIIKIRWSWGHLIFIMEIPIYKKTPKNVFMLNRLLARRCFYFVPTWMHESGVIVFLLISEKTNIRCC